MAAVDQGCIFDIKKYSINDGPGIRVTVFFKGCPLRCAWCHNPEGISPRVEKMYNNAKCIGCRACVTACPENACSLTDAGIVTDLARCTACGTCADVCPTTATEMSGRLVTLGEVLAVVDRERVFFEHSEGGVTISGGEPLQQPKFLLALLGALGQRGIHRAVDTTGLAPSHLLLEVARHSELFLYDLKLINSSRQKQWTGVANELILDNLRLLAESGAEINIRIPLVAGVNDDQENIEQTASLIAGLAGPRKKVNLLPYHNIMTNKYLRLGSEYRAEGMGEPSPASLTRIIAQFAEKGIEAVVGG
jgi:pyruvate formate lyase activating enzyme